MKSSTWWYNYATAPPLNITKWSLKKARRASFKSTFINQHDNRLIWFFFCLFCFVLTVLFHLNSNISTTFWGRLIHRVTVSVLGSSNQLFIFDRLCELPLRFLTFGSYINWALNLLILLNLPTQCSRGSGDLGVKEAGLCLCWCAQSRVWSRAVLQLFMYVVDFPFKINVKKLSVYSSQ